MGFLRINSKRRGDEKASFEEKRALNDSAQSSEAVEETGEIATKRTSSLLAPQRKVKNLVDITHQRSSSNRFFRGRSSKKGASAKGDGTQKEDGTSLLSKENNSKVSTDAAIRHHGGTDIWTACKVGDLLYVQQTINSFPELIHLTLQGRSPLYLACHGGHTAVVQALLEAGAVSDMCTSALSEDVRVLLKQYRLIEEQLIGNSDVEDEDAEINEEESSGSVLLNPVVAKKQLSTPDTESESLVDSSDNNVEAAMDFLDFSSWFTTATTEASLQLGTHTISAVGDAEVEVHETESADVPEVTQLSSSSQGNGDGDKTKKKGGLFSRKHKKIDSPTPNPDADAELTVDSPVGGTREGEVEVSVSAGNISKTTPVPPVNSSSQSSVVSTPDRKKGFLFAGTGKKPSTSSPSLVAVTKNTDTPTAAEEEDAAEVGTPEDRGVVVEVITAAAVAVTPSTSSQASTKASVLEKASPSSSHCVVVDPSTPDRKRGLFTSIMSKRSLSAVAKKEEIATPDRGVVVAVAVATPSTTSLSQASTKTLLQENVMAVAEDAAAVLVGTPDRGTVEIAAAAVATATPSSSPASTKSCLPEKSASQPPDRKGLFAGRKNKRGFAAAASATDAASKKEDVMAAAEDPSATATATTKKEIVAAAVAEDSSSGTPDLVQLAAALVAAGAVFGVALTEKEEAAPSKKEDKEPHIGKEEEMTPSSPPTEEPQITEDSVEVTLEAFGMSLVKSKKIHLFRKNNVAQPQHQQQKADTTATTEVESTPDLEKEPVKESELTPPSISECKEPPSPKTPKSPPSILRNQVSFSLPLKNMASMSEQARSSNVRSEVGVTIPVVSTALVAGDNDNCFTSSNTPEVDHEENNVTTVNDASDSDTSSENSNDDNKDEDSTCETESSISDGGSINGSIEDDDDKPVMDEFDEDLSAGKDLVRTASKLIFQAPKSLGIIKEEVWCMFTGMDVDDHCGACTGTYR